MTGACITHGRDEKCIQNFGRKTWRKKLLGRPGRRWEDNIKMDPRKVGWEGVDRIHLAQYRDQRRAVVNTVRNLRVL